MKTVQLAGRSQDLGVPKKLKNKCTGEKPTTVNIEVSVRKQDVLTYGLSEIWTDTEVQHVGHGSEWMKCSRGEGQQRRGQQGARRQTARGPDGSAMWMLLT